MGARQKLNVAYLHGALLLAGVLGLLTRTWPVFFLTLTILLGLNLYLNEIRLSKTAQHSRKR